MRRDTARAIALVRATGSFIESRATKAFAMRVNANKLAPALGQTERSAVVDAIAAARVVIDRVDDAVVLWIDKASDIGIHLGRRGQRPVTAVVRRVRYCGGKD